jgi:DNA-binding Xre family transcriptional regulator
MLTLRKDGRKMNLSELVRVERARRRMKMTRLSQKSGVPLATLAKIESGAQKSTSFENGLMLCIALDVPWKTIKELELFPPDEEPADDGA